MREIMYTEVREEISYACNRRSDRAGDITRGLVDLLMLQILHLRKVIAPE